MTEHYFLYPFGINGTLNAIPNPTQVSGIVSYEAGFPIGYQLANTAPGYLSVPRDQFNQLMFDTTGAIQQLQQTGFPSWITSAANGGSSFPYALGAQVWSGGIPYRSLIANNTDTPPTSNWEVIGENVSLYFNFAADTGSANVYVIAPNPAPAAYAAGQVFQMQPTFANTGACTLNVSGIGAISIKTLLNQDPAANMIIPAGMYQFEYNAVTGCAVIQNPSPVTVNSNVGSFTNSNITVDGLGRVTAASNGGLTLVGPASFNSSTSYNVTGIPSGIRQLNILLNNVTTNANSNMLFQIGTAGGLVTSGYTSNGQNALSSNASASSTAGIVEFYTGTYTVNGKITFDLVDAANNVWVASYVGSGASGGGCNFGGGTVTLSGPLSQFNFTTVGGSATWNAGKISYSYW